MSAFDNRSSTGFDMGATTEGLGIGMTEVEGFSPFSEHEVVLLIPILMLIRHPDHFSVARTALIISGSGILTGIREVAPRPLKTLRYVSIDIHKIEIRVAISSLFS